MSFPYYLDLAFGSEKAFADSSCRISFGKPVVVGDKVRFISNTYQVSNDYTIEGNSVVPTITKEAYSVLEINKSDYDENRDLFDSLYGQLSIDSNAGSVVQRLLFGSMSNFELMVPLTSTPLNIGEPAPEDLPCVLTTVSSYIYILDTSSPSLNPLITSKVGPVTIKTYIDDSENTDSSYIIVDDMDVSVTKEGEESNLPKSLLELNTLVSQGKAYEISIENLSITDIGTSQTQWYSAWNSNVEKGKDIMVLIDHDNVEGFVSVGGTPEDPIYNGSVIPKPTYGTIYGYSSYWNIHQGILLDAPTYYVVLKEAV